MSIADFSQEQLDVVCMSLYQAEDGPRLVKLFMENTNNHYLHPAYASQPVLIAYVFALLYSKRYEAMFDLVAKTRFDEQYFKELQDLWYLGRYRENAEKRGKELGPVEKYRLRRKYPPPPSIWDGQETVYSFKENSRKKLRDFYLTNKYPSIEDKKEISRQTDLKIVQISNWFKNRRQRDKTCKEPYEREGCLMNGINYNNINVMHGIHLARRVL